ncbi:hypothetical protein ACFVAF_37090 [Streptomyces sp. NPDC057596]|uniref:hypothetical protein n=1 Tax=Streptomyces sp. NPDC057596 TaxID=3346178 RepID=UPI00369D607F
MTAPFSRAAAERLLGPAVVEEIRRQVDAAPPIRPEQRAHVRALFATASPQPVLKPAARAA